MSLTIRIINPISNHVLVDTPGINAKLNFGLNETSQFDVEIPANFPGIEYLENGQIVEIYFEGNLLLLGTIQDKSDSQGETLQINGRSLLDSLYTEKSWAYAYYQGVPFHSILSELLLTGDWRLGDIQTMENPDTLTTIDLRSERNLLTQINKLLEGATGSFYREGDIILGFPTLDVGSFRRESGLIATRHPAFTTDKQGNPFTYWINKLNFITLSSDAYYGVRPEGGKVNNAGTDTIITLQTTFQDNPAQAFDPDFPIIEELKDRSYIMLNLRDFENPGGTVISQTAINTTIALGDFSGPTAPVDNRWGLISFVPIPGILEYITLQTGPTVGTAWGGTWKIAEIATDYLTVLDILYESPTTIPATDLNQALYRFQPESPVLLEKGKIYAILLGIQAPLASNEVWHIDVQGVAETNSHFRFNFFASGVIPTVGSVASVFSRECNILIKTLPTSTRTQSLVTEKAPKYTPPKTGAAASAPSILANSQTLALWARAFLNDHGIGTVKYEMDAEITRNLPKPGDTIYVDSQATQQYYDRLRNKVITGSVSHVQKDLRVDSFNVDISGDSIKGSFNLSEGDTGRAVDQFVDLYDEASERGTPEGALPTFIWQLLSDTIILPISAASPNAFNAYGQLAYETQISIFDGAYAVRPSDVEQIYVSGIPTGDTDDTHFVVELLSRPDLYSPQVDVIVKVGFKNRNWTFSDSINIAFRLLWR